MIPPTSKNFLVNNLAAGTQYDLCVLAIYDDGMTSLTATRVVGCVQFTTESEYLRCHFMQSQFLGGTMIIIIGGIIVASVLVFIIILMIRYKVCNSSDSAKGRMVTTNVHSQTNGAQSQGCTVTPSVSKQAMGGKDGGGSDGGGGGGAGGSQKGPPPDTLTHSSETTSLAECSTATSQFSQGWTTAGSSGTLKSKRKGAAPKPAGTPGQASSGAAKSPEPQIEVLLNAETQNTNRNNSTALQQPPMVHFVAAPAPGPSHPPPQLPPARFKDTPILRRVHQRPSGSKYLTLPVEGTRAKRRYSLNEDLSKHHCYIGSTKFSSVWSAKRSLSMNGMLLQLENPDLEGGKATHSSAEWILESTV